MHAQSIITRLPVKNGGKYFLSRDLRYLINFSKSKNEALALYKHLVYKLPSPLPSFNTGREKEKNLGTNVIFLIHNIYLFRIIMSSTGYPAF
jgi:hypothetical protein